jgi:hypothetical protein
LAWIAVIAITFSLLFGTIQLVSNYLRASPSGVGSEDLHSIRAQIENLESRLIKYEMTRTSTPPNVAAPPVAPEKRP